MRTTALLLIMATPAFAGGIFDGSNPGIEHHHGGWNNGEPRIMPIPPVQTPGGFGGGVGGIPGPVDPGNRATDPNATARANANSRSIASANVKNNISVGGGGVNIRYPQQAPSTFVSGYGSFSPSSCMGSVGLGGSGPGASGTLLFPWESGACNTRQNSAQMDAYGFHKTSCQIMRDEFEEVDAAMQKTGEDCANPQSRFASMPYPGAVVNSAQEMPSDVVRRPELNQKLDNAHRLGAMK